MSHIVHDGPRQGDRVDAGMALEAAILGGDGGKSDRLGYLFEPLVARTGGRQRLVQDDTVAVDNGRRCVGMDGRDGAEAQPERKDKETAGEAAGTPDSAPSAFRTL